MSTTPITPRFEARLRFLRALAFGIAVLALGCSDDDGATDVGPPDATLRDGCVTGGEGCPCRAPGSGPRCEDDLACNLGTLVCEPCDGTRAGCPCVDGRCAGLVCDADSRRCRPSRGCSELSCDENELCTPGNATEDASCGGCLPGFVSCDTGCCPRSGASCDGDGSIAEECAELGRRCESVADGAQCGTCLSMTARIIGGACVEGCQACEALRRVCIEGEGECGACNDGFAAIGSEEACTPTCDNLACGRRTCSAGPPARCEEACVEGFVWDPGLRDCRSPRTCDDCTRMGLGCMPASDGSDAICTGDACGPGTGRDTSGTCRTCTAGGSRSCSGPGLTGERFVDASGTCFCQPEDGFFTGADEVTGISCDFDRDGWVNDSAAPFVLGAADPRRARCALRRINRLVLQNEDGESFPEAVDALPLFESPRNDGSTSAPTISEGSYTFDPAALNSLTKACATGTSDFNDNTLADVEEHASSMIPAGWPRSSAVLPLHRDSYLRYAYFVELHTSELRRASDGSHELWIIERPRSASHAPGHVPVRQREGASDYWASCQRHDDADYGVDSMSRAGGEFTHLRARMHHHSQFKCVEVTSRPATRANPERLMLPVAAGECGAPLCRRTVDGSALELEPVRWVLNQCTAMGGGANPAFGCSVVAAPVEGVFWASVDYENATESSSTYEYTRGCINECAELGATECDGAPPGLPADSPQFVCQFAATDAFGKAVCGCATNYGGVDAAGNPTCDIGCPSEHLFSNRTYDENGEARGEWVCAHPTTSAHVLTSTDGAIRLVGEIPMSGGGGEVLEGGGYTLQASSIVAP